MCRLLGLTNFNFSKHSRLAEGFLDLAESGNVLPDNTPGHLDGWGIGYYKNKKAKVIKSGSSAVTQRAKILLHLSKIKTSPVLILHLRKSSWDGTSRARHAHPFVFNNMIFAHNGTIHNYKELLGEIPKKFRPGPGSLDTEVFFRYLVSKGYENMESSLEKISSSCNYSALNCLVTDGQSLCAYRNYTKSKNYYTLYKSESLNTTIISSEPLE